MTTNLAAFQSTAKLFQSGQYSQGLQLINSCIQQNPHNSTLYGNRSLFHIQKGHFQLANQDIERSLSLNHLNYISYFNRFSLLIREGKPNEAFDSLCCSLSCLYFIRAKETKNELDIAKSIKYAENNFQAHVLKGFIHLQNKKYKLALNEFEWSCDINPENKTAMILKQIVQKKIDPAAAASESIQVGQGDYRKVQNSQFLEKAQVKPNEKALRLESSCKLSDFEDTEKQITEKVTEFNEIFQSLNDSKSRKQGSGVLIMKEVGIEKKNTGETVLNFDSKRQRPMQQEFKQVQIVQDQQKTAISELYSVKSYQCKASPKANDGKQNLPQQARQKNNQNQFNQQQELQVYDSDPMSVMNSLKH